MPYDRFWVVVATSFDQAFVSFKILDPAAKKVAIDKHAKDCWNSLQDTLT